MIRHFYNFGTASSCKEEKTINKQIKNLSMYKSHTSKILLKHSP